MNNLNSYIKSEKVNNENSINKINEKIGRSNIEIHNIENKIVEFTKNIDTTYEIFSPNAYDKDYNVVEIEKLNLKKNEIIGNIEKLNESKKELIARQKKIDLAYDELFELQNRIVESENSAKNIIEKETERSNKKFSNEVTKVMEYQINKESHFVESEVVKQLEIIENKLSLCDNFIDMDINRARLEILKISEEISYFKKRITSEMFHVKHFEDDSEVEINEEIKNFINQYKKAINSKVEYKYTGDKIKDIPSNIINLIRIIKEAVDNADNYSNGNVIHVSIIVDRFVNEKNTTENKSEKSKGQENENEENRSEEGRDTDSGLDNSGMKLSNNDMHQINFVIDETTDKYNVTIKISDNGDGFKLQEDKVLLKNGLYGIYLMKYRTEKINGKFNIQSEKGLGTTVTVVYQVG